jgi:gamma-glutamyltranspeptidase/glutathione hydrolase
MRRLDLNPFLAERMPVIGAKGMVATTQPLAAQAGLDMLKKGGNAIDAAVAAAAALTVTEPTSNGIGSDAFAIVWHGGRIYGLNASGPAPRGISIDKLAERGMREMPKYGWTPVTVPGAPAAWAALSERFGRLPLSAALEPAVVYAREGFPVSPVVAGNWSSAFRTYKEELRGDVYQAWFETFAPGGRPPGAGEIWRSAGHADSLEAIARSGARDFYEGDLAERIAAASMANGGFLRREDLADYQVQWVEPLKVDYRGYEVWELPPNGQGIVALMALNMLKGFDPYDGSEEAVHRQIEAIKLAFADGLATITDPDRMPIPARDLLSDAYAEERRKQIGGRAQPPLAGKPLPGGTVYLAAADGEGNMVSFIQSNYMGFGSGVVVPGTGISLQNRGYIFSLDPNHVNALEPGKKTFHTIIPGFLTKGGVPVGPFGVMGDYMQPQGHVQLLNRLIDQGFHPQAGLDAPRWRWREGLSIDIEPRFPMEIAQALLERGHRLNVSLQVKNFGRGQAIWRTDQGVYIGGSDSRADGIVAAW